MAKEGASDGTDYRAEPQSVRHRVADDDLRPWTTTEVMEPRTNVVRRKAKCVPAYRSRKRQ